MSNRGGSMSHERAAIRALIYGDGTPEFIAQCKEEFSQGQKLINRPFDPELSRKNLEALRNGKLNFITNKGDV